MASADDIDVFTEALALPPDERARLARELLASLSEGEDPDAATYWLDEIERRAKEVRDGTAQFEDWDSVRARLESRWRK